MRIDEYVDWCESIGFNSLAKVYDDAMKAESELSEFYEKLEEQNIIPDEIKEHSDLMMKYLKKGIIKENQIDDSTSVLAFATNRLDLVRVISADKIVSVDNSLYQYNENNVKIIPDNNFDLIKDLDNQSQSNNSIIVKDLPKYYVEGVYIERDDTWGPFFSRRRNITYLSSKQYLDGDEFSTYFLLNMYFYKKILGTWRVRETIYELSDIWYSVIFKRNNESLYTLLYFYEADENIQSSYVYKPYIHNGFCGNINDYVSTPHIYRGNMNFSCDDENWTFQDELWSIVLLK